MSMNILADQCRYMLWFAEPMLKGLDDTHLALEPVRGNKSAGWILGHLVITADFGRKLCGRAPMYPKEWRATFSPGTTSGIDPGLYPRMSELVTALPLVYTDLADAIVAADDSVLNSVNPFEPARGHFPTVREFLPWLITGHLGYHIGQLGDWRRAAGLGHEAHI